MPNFQVYYLTVEPHKQKDPQHSRNQEDSTAPESGEAGFHAVVASDLGPPFRDPGAHRVHPARRFRLVVSEPAADRSEQRTLFLVVESNKILYPECLERLEILAELRR